MGKSATAIGILSFLPMILIFGINAAIFGTISVNMARQRGLRTVPAFWAGTFGSFFTLFYIAMHPKKEEI